MKKIAGILISIIVLIACFPVYAFQTTTAKTPIELYKGNARINAFLNAYNFANPDSQFTAFQFKSYYHHGRSHEEQAIASINNLEILISEYAWSDIKVIITGTKETTAETYKEVFFEYARAFNDELDETKLESYWQEINSRPYNGGGDFEEFNVDLSKHNNHIDSIFIEGSFPI